MPALVHHSEAEALPPARACRPQRSHALLPTHGSSAGTPPPAANERAEADAEQAFEQYAPGVVEVVSGYAGGTIENPSESCK